MLSELIVTVGDLDDAVTFYTESLGMDYVRRITVDGGPLVQLRSGELRVSLIRGPKPGVRMVFATRDVDATSRQLVRQGVEVQVAPKTAAGSTVLPFTDPWGNPLAFWQP